MIIPCNKIPNKKKSSLRKQASDFAFALYDSVGMVNAEHWNKIVKSGSEFLELDYLRVLENNNPPNMRFHYSIIYKETTPVAIAYFQVIDFNAEGWGSKVDKEDETEKCLHAVLKQYLKRGVNRLNIRLLLCGNAFISGEHGFTCSSGIDKKEAFDALADIIYRIARAEKLRGKIAAVLVKDFYQSSVENAIELKEFKYHDFEVEPNMIIHISEDWKTFDDYLAAISKKYRTRAKSIIKKGTTLVTKDFSAGDISANAEQVMKLYNNVHLKAHFRLATLSANYFSEMKKEMKDRFVFTAYYLDDKMVGFRSSFILHEEVEAHFIGLDYSINKEYELYQNILYDYLREAISHHAKELQLGRTASEIKSNVGAKAHELTCYIRHRNPISNRIIKPFIDYLKPSEWIPRNPFKEA